MNGESQIELILSILVLGLSTALATGYVRLPSELLKSPLLKIFLVVFAMVAFTIYPMVGLSLFFLLAVLIFSSNVETTIHTSRNYQPIMRSLSGPNLEIKEYDNQPQLPPLPDNRSATLDTFPVTERPEVLHTGNTTYGERSIQAHNIDVPNPYSRFKSDPRSFLEFNETDSSNPVLGKIVEGFMPANYGDEQGAPVEGQYPKEIARSSSTPDLKEYNFRPAEDTGSNEFVPVVGPNLDEKTSSLKY